MLIFCGIISETQHIVCYIRPRHDDSSMYVGICKLTAYYQHAVQHNSYHVMSLPKECSCRQQLSMTCAIGLSSVKIPQSWISLCFLQVSRCLHDVQGPCSAAVHRATMTAPNHSQGS